MTGNPQASPLDARPGSGGRASARTAENSWMRSTRCHPDHAEFSFPSIGSLGAIGDCQSMALVAPDGTVEWLCPLRFDAPPLLWTLLDRAGGHLRIGPDVPVDVQVRYVGESAVVELEWLADTGAVRAMICMAWPPQDRRQQIVWILEGISGFLDLCARFRPRPDFGRFQPRLEPASHGVVVRTRDYACALSGSCQLDVSDEEAHGRFRLAAGERAAFVLELGMLANGTVDCAAFAAEAIASTVGAWRQWSSRLRYVGAYRQAVVRSAITLKMLIHEETGAVVAAATTSLPERVGGIRNWDYRFSWFRDAGMTLGALYGLGCRREAARWAEWMQAAIARHGIPLRVLYRIDGTPAPDEEDVATAAGYRGSRPVRVGNAAECQFQLDMYGEILDCVFICDEMGDADVQGHWPHLRAAADFIAEHWRDPDRGIWEPRSPARHYVHSKVSAWRGLSNAIWLANRHRLPANLVQWRNEATVLREEVLAKGVSCGRSHFVRSYGEDALDASLLRVARSGFVEPGSRLFRNTVAAVTRSLGSALDPALLRRYAADGSDGLPGSEGYFLACSFWRIQALALMGEQQQAKSLFEHMLAKAGLFGLFAEMADDGGNQLGNFPQAFTHVAVINTASLFETGRPSALQCGHVGLL